MLSLRPATAADIPLIRELCFQVWPQTYAPMLPAAQIDFMLEWMYSPQTLQQQLASGVTYLLCYDDNMPVGFASWHDEDGGKCKLDKIYVLPNQQGKGSGRFMLEHIATAAQARGCGFVQLHVNKQNPARRFYEKLGFFVAQEAVFDIGHGFVMDDCIMQLDLPRRGESVDKP